jgi:hypothetical protein
MGLGPPSPPVHALGLQREFVYTVGKLGQVTDGVGKHATLTRVGRLAHGFFKPAAGVKGALHKVEVVPLEFAEVDALRRGLR